MNKNNTFKTVAFGVLKTGFCSEKAHHLSDKLKYNEETVFSFTTSLCKMHGDKKIISTERLYLREMNQDDYDALYAVLADADIMQHYPYAFDEERKS